MVRALQSQINPHFLNNTLQIIGTLALSLKVPQIYGLLSALAKMMRYSMYNDEKVVTVQNEPGSCQSVYPAAEGAF